MPKLKGTLPIVFSSPPSQAMLNLHVDKPFEKGGVEEEEEEEGKEEGEEKQTIRLINAPAVKTELPRVAAGH